MRITDDVARFWANVKKAGPDDCWLWTGGTRGLPGYHYGVITYKGRREGAHRASWLIAHEPIEGDLEVMHICDNRLCVNPAHLCLGSHQENIQDAAHKLHMQHGERNHFHRLTADRVIEIRQLCEQGYTNEDIGE